MTTTGVNLFSALPGDVLRHELSFLPSRDAVQASVLSRRWRHLWRSTPALRVPGLDTDARRYPAFILFVNRFLLLRDGASPLRTFEIDVCHYNDGDDDEFDLWIRHAALTCQTLDVAASANVERCILRLTSGPLANAQHLTTLRLSSVRLHGDFLDLSRCPALVHLSLSKCRLDCKAIVSRLLRRLSVVDCFSGWTTTSLRISTPSLSWLHLAEPPRFLLESMPSLTAATVLLSRGKLDDCSSRSVLLDALSEATSLELMASSSHGQVGFLFYFYFSYKSIQRLIKQSKHA
ncbi:unnamed protein product [Alopecurus aequalis]